MTLCYYGCSPGKLVLWTALSLCLLTVLTATPQEAPSWLSTSDLTKSHCGDEGDNPTAADCPVELDLPGLQQCPSLSPGPIYNETTFAFLQQVYRQSVPPSENSISDDLTSGLVAPHKVDFVSGKGRGVIATQDILRGSVVWRPVQHAVFRSERSFRLFLSRLPLQLVCDILMWSYVDRDRTGLAVTVELDNGSFMNHGDSPNTKEQKKARGGSIVAARHIKAGEEITIDYDALLSDRAIEWYKALKSKRGANLVDGL